MSPPAPREFVGADVVEAVADAELISPAHLVIHLAQDVGGIHGTGTRPVPVDSTNVLAKVDHQVSGADQFSVRYACTTSARRTRAAPAGSTRRAPRPASTTAIDMAAFGNTLDALGAHGHRNARAVRARRSGGASRRPDRPRREHRGRGVVRNVSGSPTRRVNTMYQVVNNLSHQAGAHALRAGVDVLLQRRPHHLSARRFAAPTRSRRWPNFLAGIYNNAGFTQTFGASEVSQTNPNVGVYAQDEWKVGSGCHPEPGLRYDLQFLETINTDTNNVSPRVGLAWSPFDSRRTVVRGSAGLFYDRVPLRALANALLSAGNTTDLTKLRQIGVSLSPTQAGAPVFPNILSARRPVGDARRTSRRWTATCRTPTRGRPASRSSSSSASAARSASATSTCAARTC